jgi:hypothetical protein
LLITLFYYFGVFEFELKLVLQAVHSYTWIKLKDDKNSIKLNYKNKVCYDPVYHYKQNEGTELS